MMVELEDSTIDLVHRRRVRSNIPGYVVMGSVLAMLAALPLVRVDVVTTAAGMVRPLLEPVMILAPMTGILDSTILVNNTEVYQGDTVGWFRRDHPETRIGENTALITANLAQIRDIRRILDGKKAVETGRYLQSYRNYLADLARLRIRKDFLQREYMTAAHLYRSEVIPLHEYEEAESRYQLLLADIKDLRENYRNQLEEELYRLGQENRACRKEIALTRSTLRDYFIVAPATGTLHGCPGVTAGSVIRSGMELGTVSPAGGLAAECFLDPARIQGITPGTPVRLRFEGSGYQMKAQMETEVDHIEKDVVMIDGRPFYRVRCTLQPSGFIETDGKKIPLAKGMTFSASLVLFRRSLFSLIMERLNRRINPAGTNPDA